MQRQNAPALCKTDQARVWFQHAAHQFQLLLTHLVELHGSPLQQVHHTPGRSHAHIHAVGEGTDLGTDWGSSVECIHLQPWAQGAELTCNLQTKESMDSLVGWLAVESVRHVSQDPTHVHDPQRCLQKCCRIGLCDASGQAPGPKGILHRHSHRLPFSNVRSRPDLEPTHTAMHSKSLCMLLCTSCLCIPCSNSSLWCCARTSPLQTPPLCSL